jgi:hypothetical protein
MQHGNLTNLASALLNHQGSKTSNKDWKKNFSENSRENKKCYSPNQKAMIEQSNLFLYNSELIPFCL